MSDDKLEINIYPKKIIKNTLYAAAGNWIVLILNFLIIPFIIGKLGIELYGSAWVIGILIIASAPLIDFGLGAASIKYISEYHAIGRYDKINSLVSTGIFYYFIFGVVLFLVALFFGKNIIYMIGVPTVYLFDAYFVMLISTLILVINNTLSPLTSVLNSLQRMDISNKIGIFTAVINIIQIIAVLSSNLGIKGLIIGYLIVNCISAFLFIYFSFKLLPQLKPRFSLVDKQTFKLIWDFGINLQISRLSQIVVLQFDRIFALRYFGSSSAAFYEIAAKISNLARTIPLVLTSAIMPASSEMDARRENDKLKILFERGSKYIIVIGLLLLGYIFMMSQIIIQTWLGKTVSMDGIMTASMVLKILIVGYFINVSTGIASSIAAGINRTDIERNVGLYSFVSPVLTILLINSLGYYGIALSTGILLILGSLYYMIQFTKAIKAQLIAFMKLFLKPMISLLVAIIVIAAVQYIFNLTIVHSRWEGIAILIFYFIIFSISYSIPIYLLGVVDEYDKSILKMLAVKLRIVKTQ